MTETQENQLENYDDIDALLAEEFKLDDSKEEKTEEPTGAEVVAENKSSNVTESVEDTQKEEQKDVTSGQDIKDITPEVTKPSKEEKEENAFAALRKQATDEKIRADKETEFIKDLAASYGYTDVEKFKADVKIAKMQNEATAKGIDPEVYKTIQEQKERIQALESQTKQKELNQKAEDFRNSIETAEKTYNVKREEIFTRLEEAGYTVDTILALPSVDIVIRGVLSDKIKEFSKQEQIDKIKELDNFSDEKHDSTAKETKLSLEDIIKKELEQYKADNYL